MLAGAAPPEPEPGAPCAQAFKLDYEFAAGWRFVRCIPDVKPAVVIPGRPQAFGVRENVVEIG